MEQDSKFSEETSFKIKEVTAEDWKKLRDIYLKLLKTDPKSFVDTYEEAASLTEEDWKEDLERRGETFAAVDMGKFIGMGRINFYDELPDVPVLHKLGVLPGYRGKGIARKIITAREEWAQNQGAAKVRLYVMKGNEKMIEFSRKNGYHVVENAEDSPPGQVIMEKSVI